VCRAAHYTKSGQKTHELGGKNAIQHFSLPLALRENLCEIIKLIFQPAFLLRCLMPSPVIEILSADEVRRTVNRLASQIVERERDLSKLALLGVYTRGVPLARVLARQIERLEQVKVPIGSLDITFYRDDLDQINLRTPQKTEVPFDVSGKTIVLVDDVIFKGRTVRAALNAVNDYGRPALIRLAVLLDRGHREVPIHPDFVGKELPTGKEEQVKVYLQETDGRDRVELIRAIGGSESAADRAENAALS
jgi:pyrimidine operon attenuation protein / uracil phosphoribosyltransferase